MSTVNVQGRIDMKSLAAVARAYVERGSTFGSRSDLMWRIVEDAAIAAENSGATRPNTDEEALQYLRQVGLNIAMSDRSRREVRRALIDDVGVHDYYSEDLFARRVTKAQLKNRPKNTQTDEELFKELYEAGVKLGYKGTYEEYTAGMRGDSGRLVRPDAALV